VLKIEKKISGEKNIVILRREIGRKREVPERKQHKEEDSRGKLIGWWNKERESRNKKKNEETRKVVTR
jgi:hypothetical protein